MSKKARHNVVSMHSDKKMTAASRTYVQVKCVPINLFLSSLNKTFTLI
jgi:hypothetical protein